MQVKCEAKPSNAVPDNAIGSKTWTGGMARRLERRVASQRCLRAHCVIVSSGRENKIGKEINKRVDQRGAIRLTPSERSTTTWLAGPGEVVIAAGGVLISSPGTRHQAARVWDQEQERRDPGECWTGGNCPGRGTIPRLY